MSYSRTLAYKVVPSLDLAVFAELWRAEYVAQVTDAIKKSGNWGQFKAAMPEDDYLDIIDQLYGEGNEPSGETPFEPSCVPGFCDGDYPPWLMSEMGHVIPRDILEKHGTCDASVFNGFFWKVPKENLDRMCADLKARGYELQHTPDLDFH